MRVHEDITWYWLYHQNSTLSGHTPLLRKQHGRHTVTRDNLNRQLLFVDSTQLSVSGFLIDEVNAVVESRFCGLDHDSQNSETTRNGGGSSSKASQNEGHQIKNWLDVYAKARDAVIPEITFQADDPSIFIASTLQQRYRIDNLHEINELCRNKLPTSSRSLDTESWLTFIWRDLLEAYSTLVNMSEVDFNEQFHDLAHSEKSLSGATWLSNLVSGEVRTVRELPQLNVLLRELLQPPRISFTTETSGFYGISPLGA